jgi:hypothetical protein
MKIAGSVKLISVAVSKPIIAEIRRLSIQSENVIPEGTDDDASSTYSEKIGKELTLSINLLSGFTDPSNNLSMAQTSEIQQEIANLWSTCCSDETTEQSVFGTALSSPEESTSTSNRNSTCSTEKMESASSRTISSNSPYLTALRIASQNADTSHKPQLAKQRRPFTLNEILELDLYCERRQDSLKRGHEWVELFWGFESAQKLFLWKYGWEPEIERIEEFWRKKEQDRNFWQLWDFPSNLI